MWPNRALHCTASQSVVPEATLLTSACSGPADPCGWAQRLPRSGMAYPCIWGLTWRLWHAGRQPGWGVLQPVQQHHGHERHLLLHLQPEPLVPGHHHWHGKPGDRLEHHGDPFAISSIAKVVAVQSWVGRLLLTPARLPSRFGYVSWQLMGEPSLQRHMKATKTAVLPCLAAHTIRNDCLHGVSAVHQCMPGAAWMLYRR